ncbi:transcriptional repressor [Vibrio sp.]|nr:transcriptional repressor [Vibrio sp.]
MNHTTNALTALEQAEIQCKQHGARLTPKRKNILLMLLESEKALSAYEIADLYKDKFEESMPAMSIYRILDFLQEQHLAHKLQLANKYVACIHISCSHEHETPQFLICIQCSKVKEVSIKKAIVDEFKSNVTEAGFALASPQLEVNCICQSCQDDRAH